MTATEQNPIALATNAIAMARAMQRLGRTERAIVKYEEALAFVPDSAETLEELLDLLAERDDWTAVAEHCARWLAEFPDHATHKDAGTIHTRRLDALHELGGIDRAFDAYGLEPVARTDSTIDPTEIICVLGIRNEGRRLPAFLDHHRRLGVDRFVVVDNDSEDDSLELLVAQPDTIVWRTSGSYRAANCGAVWWDLVLRRYASGNWCLILDADEHLVIPDDGPGGLIALCAALDADGATCLPTVSLDMYPSGRLSEAVIVPGQDPLEVFPYFERVWFRRRRPFAGPRHNLLNHWGGVRARMLGGHDLGGFLLDKMPLLRHRAGETIMSGNHWLDRPSAEISDTRGALLHFKYDAHFTDLVQVEAARGEHAGEARTYRHMAAELVTDPDPVFFDPAHSVRFEGAEQLLRLGIMRTSADPDDRSSIIDRVPVPPVAPAAGAPQLEVRPLVSVVILDGSAGTLTAIEAALEALAERPASEIVLVRTATSRTDLGALPASGPHRIVVVSTSQNLPEAEAGNLGIANATGEWVHVLTADWRCSPDAYSSVASASASAEVVAISTEADPLDLALDAAPAEVILRRDRLTECGGFAPTIATASTWELVQRAVASGRSSVAADAPAVRVGRPPTPIGFGEELTHRLEAVARTGRARSLDDATMRSLHDRCAVDALRLITAELEAGRTASALASLTEILGAPIDPTRAAELVHSIGRRIR